MTCMELPRDLELALLRHMDIDARRALGVYSKLRVPERLLEDLRRCLQQPQCDAYVAWVEMHPRIEYDASSTYTCTIYRYFGQDNVNACVAGFLSVFGRYACYMDDDLPAQMKHPLQFEYVSHFNGCAQQETRIENLLPPLQLSTLNVFYQRRYL